VSKKKEILKEKIRSEEELTPIDRKVIDHVCHKCNFYHEDQEYYEEEYECVAYELIRYMLRNKLISTEKIDDLFTQIDLNPERELRSGH